LNKRNFDSFIEFENEWIKFNGIIFEKAETENNFEETYTKVFERFFEMQLVGFNDIIEILGEVGS